MTDFLMLLGKLCDFINGVVIEWYIFNLIFKTSNLNKHIMINILNYGCKWCICYHCIHCNEENVAYYLMWCTKKKNKLVKPYHNGDYTYQSGDMVLMGCFFEKVKKWVIILSIYFFMLEYISCQYNYLVIVVWIQLT